MFYLLFIALTIIVKCSQDNIIVLASGHEDLRLRLMERKYHLQVFLLTHSKIDCPVCISTEQTLTKVHELMGGNVVMFKLDCANEMTDLSVHCRSEYHSRLPDVTFLQPEFRPNQPYHPLDDIRFQPKEIPYTQQVNSATIMKFAEKYLPWYFQVIETGQNYKKWINSWPLLVKVAYFDDFIDANESPAFLRMISADFKMDLDVAYVQCDIGLQNKGTFAIYVKNETLIYQGIKTYKDVKLFILEFYDKHQLLEKIFGNYGLTEKQLSNWEELDNELQKETQLWVAVYVGESQPKLDQQFKEMQSFFKDFLTYYIMKISDKPKDIKIKSLPTILVYPLYPRNLNDPIIVKQKTKMNVLAEILLSSVSDRLKDGNDPDLIGKLKNTLLQGKFPIVWFYDSTSVMQKLTAITLKLHPHYSKVTDVNIQPDPNQEQYQLWNFTRLPAIYCFGEIDEKQNTHKKWSFQGVMNMKNINKFFKNIEDTKFAETFIKQSVIEVNDNSTFKKYCLDQGEPCVVALFDGVREGRLNLQVQMLESVLSQFRQTHFSWLWIDTSCHQEQLQQILGKWYNTTEVIIYIPQNHKITVLQGTFTEEKLNSLVKNSLTNQAQWIQLQNPITLENENCYEQRQQQREIYKKTKKQNQQEKIKAFEKQRDNEIKRKTEKENKVQADL